MSICKSRETRPRELVVLALGGLGDSLLLSPFIRHFHSAGTYSRILCVCRPRAKQLFDCNPYINDVITCLGQELFFWGLPLNDRDVFSPFHKVRIRRAPRGKIEVALEEGLNPGRGRGHVLKQVARRSGLMIRNWQLDLFTAPSDRTEARRILPVTGKRPVILLGFKSALVEKILPTILRRLLRRRLRRFGFTLAEVDGDQLRIGRRLMNLPGIRTMAEIAKRCAAIVTVDSFIAHLAAAVKTPAVVLFGPADPFIYGHRGNINLRASRCPPCGGTSRRKACKAPICMTEFSAKEISDCILKVATRRRR